MHVSLPPGDNKEPRLSVQLWADIRTFGVKQPAEYVVLLWYDLRRSASSTFGPSLFTYSISLFQNSCCPVGVFYQRFCTSRCPCNEVQSPWNVSKNRHWFQTFMQERNHSIFLAFLKHAETTTEPNVAHNVEAIEVDPVGDTDRGILSLFFQPCHKCKGVPVQSGFIFA